MSYQQENILQDLIDKDIEKIDKDISNAIYPFKPQYAIISWKAWIEVRRNCVPCLTTGKGYMIKMAPDSYLEKLYAQEAELNKQLEEWRIEIAAGPGLVSFSLDGMEDILSIKSLNYLTLQDFHNFIGQDIMDADEDATRKTNRFQNNKP